MGRAAAKSVTKYPDTYIQAIEIQYNPLTTEMQNVNPAMPSTLRKPVISLIGLLRETKLTVTEDKATEILREISQDKEKAYTSRSNIIKAIQ